MSIRVLVVDDSVFMRTVLKSALADTPGIEIVGSGQNGQEALAKIAELKPDVVTLDIEMPGIDGLEVLRRVMAENPMPVVMVSTKTQEGASATLEALSIGAVDYVAKPLADRSASLSSFREKVVRAVQTAAASNRKTLTGPRRPAPPAAPVREIPADAVVAIGISAGGPATLHRMMPAIPKEFPPIVITQHMPADFTRPFAERLNGVSRVRVKEAASNDALVPGQALIAPGDYHLKVVRMGGKLLAAVDQGPKVSGFRPSVDVLFESVATAVGGNCVAVVMTGMGCDGSAGIRLLKAKGAQTLAQDKDTSVVYGMPKAAYETGCVDRVVPLEGIPSAITEALSALHAVPA